MTHDSPEQLFENLLYFVQRDPESKWPWIKEHFMSAVAGDVEAAESLAHCLKHCSPIVAMWFNARRVRGDISLPVVGVVLRTTYQNGQILGGFRNLGISTRNVVRMFEAAGPHIMTPEDITTLCDLSEPLQVYRGCIGSARAAQHSLSWTTQRYMGEEFAELHANYDRQEGVVYSGIVQSKNVLAYFSGRHEFEVICRPLGVKRLVQLPVPPAEERDGPTPAEKTLRLKVDLQVLREKKLAARKFAASPVSPGQIEAPGSQVGEAP